MSVDGFFTKLNPLIRAILRSPLHYPLSRGLMLLTFTGRHSGRQYTIPVGYQSAGRNALTVMVSEARKKQWWRNYREPGPVELHVRGRTRRGRARLVDPHSDEFRELAENTVRRVPGMDRVFGIRYDRASGLTDEQAAHLAGEIAAVHIDLEEAA